MRKLKIAKTMINVTYGKPYSDDTWDYIITTDNKTVGDFINEVLKNKNEWGYFGIYNSKNNSAFGNPRCEYSDGKIIGEPLSQEYLNKEIKSISGSGGWSRSDYLFVVERSEE